MSVLPGPLGPTSFPIHTHCNFKVHFNHDRFIKDANISFWRLVLPASYVSRLWFFNNLFSFIKMFYFHFPKNYLKA